MKRFLLFLLLATTIVQLHAQCPPESNFDSDGDGVLDCIDPCPILPNSIIGNLSFESEFIGWTIPQNQGDFSITENASNVLHGTKALYVAAPNAAQFENHAIYSEEFTLEGGVGYSFRIHAKRIGNNDGDALRWALVDENGVYRHLNNYYDWTTDWTTISIDNLQINLTNFTSNRFRFRLEFGLSQTDMVVDRIEFYETNQGYDPLYEDLDNDGNPDCIDPSTLIPDNDSVLDATEITSLDYFESDIRLDLADVNTATPVGCNTNGFSGAYYKFTATENTYVNASISAGTSGGSIVNSFVIAYTATDLNATTMSDLTHLPESGCVFGSQTGFPIVNGQSYYLMVHRSDVNALTNFSFSEVPDVPQTERDALIDFYNSLGGNNWTNNTNWNTNLPVSTWFGVTTANINGQEHVTEIWIQNNNFNGSLPPSLGQLPFLFDLVLDQNNISGSLPSELSNLNNLLRISLFGNNITGNIPTSYQNMPNLNIINLGNNQLSGSIINDIGNFPNLTFLSLVNNNLVGEIPSGIGNLNNLRNLYLGNNYLTGTIPSSLGNLNNLVDLDLRNSGLTGSIPTQLGNLSSLQTLNLQDNTLSGNIPSELGNASNLFRLVVANNQLTGSIPVELTTLPNLNELQIHGNKFVFSDFENEFLFYQNNLTQFSYAPQKPVGNIQGIAAEIGETITLSTPPNLGSQISVEWYFVDDQNNYTLIGGPNMSIDVTINTEANYGRYEYYVTSTLVSGLTLIGNPITIGPDPSTHPDYDALTAIYNALDGPNWTDPWDITAPIETWDQSFGLSFDLVSNRVTSLDLGSRGLSGIIPPEVGNLTELTFLSFFSNDISGEVPVELWNLTKLTDLFLGAQQSRQLLLSSGIPAEISNMQDLFWLNLTGIPLSQPLQPELFNLPNLSSLRLEFCGLTGTLPEEFASINNLRLNGNDFTGPIPEAILNATGNQRLAIANNFFNFTELEPLVTANNYQVLEYSPQRTLDETLDIESEPGDDIVLTVNDTNLNREIQETSNSNTYQWFKDNLTIDGATENSYTITNAQPSDSGIYYCEVTNPLLPNLVIRRADINVFIDDSLSINITDEQAYNIYPNPTKDWIQLKMTKNGAYKLELFDLSGKLLMKNSFSVSNYAMNIEHLPSGIYLLKLNEGTHLITKRIIKQ